MSYARFGGTGHYIWHDDTRNQFVFNLHKVDDEMAVFLYKIFLTRPDELRKWIIKGRDIVFNWLDSIDDDEQKEYKQWLLEKENENEHYKSMIK